MAKKGKKPRTPSGARRRKASYRKPKRKVDRKLQSSQSLNPTSRLSGPTVKRLFVWSTIQFWGNFNRHCLYRVAGDGFKKRYSFLISPLSPKNPLSPSPNANAAPPPGNRGGRLPGSGSSRAARRAVRPGGGRKREDPLSLQSRRRVPTQDSPWKTHGELELFQLTAVAGLFR